MANVVTVTGEVDGASLGKVLIHEHVLCGLPGYELDVLDPLDEADAVQTAVARLRAARDCGVGTVVDATPMNWYRRPDLLVRISELSEVHIVASTGLYTERMGYPFHLKQLTPAELAGLFLRELEAGMTGTKVRAGVIKVATSGNLPGKYEQRALEAAAMASRGRGTAIVTHTEDATGGIAQAEALIGYGACAERVVIGHCDNNPAGDYHRAIQATGASTGFDRAGSGAFFDEPEYFDIVHRSIASSNIHQIFLSHDYVAVGKGRWFKSDKDSIREQYGYTYIFRRLLPELESRGLSSATLETILTDNPRRLLAGSHSTSEK
jgi:phosphotriesterase-related protein